MKYHRTTPISRKDLADALASDDSTRICQALVDLALHDPDWAFVQATCFEQSRSRHPSVRSVSATCLGHVARIHRKIDRNAASEILDRLEADPDTAPYARDAKDDLDWWLSRPRED